VCCCFFFQAEDGIRDDLVTGVQTCALPISAPNSTGTTMISGHRDTHFSFLKKLKLNDTLLIQTTDKTIRYQIHDMQVVDSTSFMLQQDDDGQSLVLVTCYPFDALTSGGSSRYLVYATAQATEKRVADKIKI